MFHNKWPRDSVACNVNMCFSLTCLCCGWGLADVSQVLVNMVHIWCTCFSFFWNHRLLWNVLFLVIAKAQESKQKRTCLWRFQPVVSTHTTSQNKLLGQAQISEVEKYIPPTVGEEEEWLVVEQESKFYNIQWNCNLLDYYSNDGNLASKRQIIAPKMWATHSTKKLLVIIKNTFIHTDLNDKEFFLGNPGECWF